MSVTQPRRSSRDWSRFATPAWCYAFMLPALVLAALFTFYPMVMSWVYSTVDWNGFSSDIEFVGLANYRELMSDGLFWDAFGRSLIFVLVGTPLRVIGALLVAIVLNQQALKLSPAFRTMFFMPVVTTAAIVGIVMTFIFGPYGGPLNEVLVSLDVVDAPVDFLGDSDTAIWAVLLTHTWKNFGITMIYWLAALQTVPQSYYEAAKVDGAGAFALLRHITLPVLLPFAVVIIVLTANENLHAFALVQAMTAGGPFFSTQVIEVYIYQTAFAADATGGGVPRLGYASAAGCFFGTAALVLALIQGIAVRQTSRMRKQLKA
ncbi:carbohydrate ABC transporter permease [Jiangella asiatica]|uniref:Sugar ABC transporter permease n=1 Tax=Jiangella asiatica TaxID=2530372 RepID=A0A4R5DS78_9ACTN|nr:sugar ABC transporter permease [Jiangella asiatica]TDE14921.1 sugar ABC transporter permease [Jiangella asiatica]